MATAAILNADYLEADVEVAMKSKKHFIFNGFLNDYKALIYETIVLDAQWSRDRQT